MIFKKIGISAGIIFFSAFLTVYTAATPLEVDAIKTAIVAGLVALAMFSKKLLASYLEDKKLTAKEVDEATSDTFEKENTL